MSTPITTRFLVGPAELRDATSDELAAFGNIDDAVAYLDQTGDGQVYRCEPVSESAHWEWTLTSPGETPSNNLYVSEQAARNSAWPGCTIWKARAGHRPLRWQPADHTL